MNPHTFHQWITRKYGFFTRHRRKYPTLVHLRFPQRKISLARYLLIKHEHITIFPQLRNRVYSFNHRFYLKFGLFFPQYHHHPAIQILPFQTGVNTRFTPTIVRKRPAAAAVGARPDFMFARIGGKIRVDSEKELYHYRDSHHSYHRQVQTGHEHEIVQLFHRFYRLQSTGFPASLPGPFTGEGYYPTPVMVNTGDPGKFEIRISKFETNSNDKNSNGQNEKNLSTLLYQHVFASNFEHYSRTTAIIPGKSPAGIVKSLTYFFEPLRHAKGHEEEKKRGNEETGKRRREGEGFLERLEPGSIYRSMIMSKTIPLSLDLGKEAFQMVRRTLIGPPRRGVDPGKEGFQMARMGLLRLPTQWGLFFFTRNRYDLNTTAVTSEKSLARMFKFPAYFFEPRRHAKGREEEKRRRNEETEKRRIKGEGFPKGLEPGSIYRSLIMSKNISHLVDSGKEGFQMARMRLLWLPTPWGLFFFTRNRYDLNTTAVTTEKSLARMFKFPTYFFEPRRHAKGREEEKKRRNEETEKRRREGEGFPKRLEPGYIYRSMIMSKMVSHVVDHGKEAFFSTLRYSLSACGHAQAGTTLLLQELSERRHTDLFFFIKNRYDSNAAVVTIEKSLARMFKFPTYFFEPRRHAKGREEEKKRRREEFRRSESQRADGQKIKEEVKMRGREAEGFPKRLEPDFIYRSLIMSKNISHVVDSGKEAFYMARMRLLWLPTPWGPERLEPDYLYRLMIMSRNISHVIDPGKEAFHMVRMGLFEKFLEVSEPFYKKVLTRRRHERNQLAVGSRPLARREEAGKRRREGQGFLERLEPGSIYRFMIMSKMVSHVVDSGKEAFHMVRRTLNGSPRRGAALDYFTPHRVSVGDRDQSLIEAGKPGSPAMDIKDKITGENIFGNHASPGISQQQMPNIDIDQLTDRVYRVLEDKIRTEKEMRGW